MVDVAAAEACRFCSSGLLWLAATRAFASSSMSSKFSCFTALIEYAQTPTQNPKMVIPVIAFLKRYGARARSSPGDIVYPCGRYVATASLLVAYSDEDMCADDEGIRRRRTLENVTTFGSVTCISLYTSSGHYSRLLKLSGLLTQLETGLALGLCRGDEYDLSMEFIVVRECGPPTSSMRRLLLAQNKVFPAEDNIDHASGKGCKICTKIKTRARPTKISRLGHRLVEALLLRNVVTL